MGCSDSPRPSQCVLGGGSLLPSLYADARYILMPALFHRPTITNADALAINHDWVGHPGTLVKAYPAVGLGSVRMATQASCGANGTTGWKLTDAGQLQASVDGGAALCLLGSQNYGPANNAISCPPATTQSGLTQCGNALFDCSQTAGKWALNTDPGNSTLSWTRKAGDKPLCLTARAGHTAPDRSASGPGGKGPASKLIYCFSIIENLLLENIKRVLIRRSTLSLSSRGGSLLPSIHADARSALLMTSLFRRLRPPPSLDNARNQDIRCRMSRCSR